MKKTIFMLSFVMCTLMTISCGNKMTSNNVEGVDTVVVDTVAVDTVDVIEVDTLVSDSI